jgi:acetate kinase
LIDRVLAVNAGSSSLKLRVLDAKDKQVGARDLEASDEGFDEPSVRAAIEELDSVDAVGHRVVHGGEVFSESVRVDGDVVAKLRALIGLAPLHQPQSLAALEIVSRALPGTPAVACFDTAFHDSLPAAAATYALPEEWRVRFGLRRYGFHGLSHAYASRRASELAGAPKDAVAIVTCHLGAGASLAAVKDGASVDTTMGFTPLEGVVMATRSGTVDPGLVMWLIQQRGMPPAEVANGLERKSGLVGLAGSADMRDVLAAAERGDDRSRLAVNVYVHRLRKAIAEMVAAMGAIDLLVFTGGIGENAPEIRRRAVEGLRFLGVALDREANRRAHGDAEIGAGDEKVRVFVVRSREELEMVKEVRRVLA